MGRTQPKPLHPEFKRFIDMQPYTVLLDGFRLTVDRDVFPPDLGRCAQNVARISRQYSPRAALDMGCGSGYLAMTLKQNGAEEVWAADIHRPAVDCTRKNVEQNARAGPITVVRSDLFENIPTSMRFDLIIFNQPYGPAESEPVCGCGPDGGYEITRRFLLEAPAFLTPGGVMIMTFSDREEHANDPKVIASELDYPVVTLLHAYYSESNNFIYEIRAPESREDP